jgi:hypothetical protein
MRILYITNICNIGEILVNEAARQDIDAHYIEYPWAKRKIKNLFDFIRFLSKYSLSEFDILHYNWPIASLLPQNRDIPYLRNRNKKIFLHYHGDDIRNKKERETLKYVDGKIISTPDLQKFLPNAQWVPFPYDIRGLQRRKGWNSTLNIIHAPSDRTRKGTTEILRAIKKLQRKYPITFELIEGKSNAYVMKKMSEADIVIDQIGPGWYGKVTLEALYSGAVSCFYLNPELASYIPLKFYCSITEKTIVTRIGELIENEGLRERMRINGYAYLAAYHDSRKIMQQLLHMYEQ